MYYKTYYKSSSIQISQSSFLISQVALQMCFKAQLFETLQNVSTSNLTYWVSETISSSFKYPY